MPTIDYLPVATAVGNNADSQVNFAGSGYQTLGFQTGIALPQQANKIWRQTSMMTAALANFIANTLSINVLDDGNLAALITNLTNAITAGAGSAPTFKTNGVNNALQSLLNLVAGTNITLANTSGGIVTVSAAGISAPAFETNGVTNVLQTLLNLIAGANITLTADVSGGVTIAAATAPPVVAASYYKALAAPLSLLHFTLYTIDSITVTFPASGGPWRVFASYNYYKNGGVHYNTYTTDGPNAWNGVDAVTADNTTGFSSGAFSPVTYANGATVTFATKFYDTGASIIEPSSVIIGTSPAKSNMQIVVMSSN
jgi:hypothetical protein